MTKNKKQQQQEQNVRTTESQQNGRGGFSECRKKYIVCNIMLLEVAHLTEIRSFQMNSISFIA